MNETINLRLESIIKKFPMREGSGEFTAVDNVSLSIQKGQFITLLGPSGCGKTTTLRLIAGFESPTSGKIFLSGKDITSQPPNQRDMTMVFQSYALFPHMSVYDNVSYGLKIKRLPNNDIQQKVRATLDLMGHARPHGTRRTGEPPSQPTLRRAAAAGGPGPRFGDGTGSAAVR